MAVSGPSVSTSSKSAVNRLYGAAVNNAILDPFQGYDADVWVIDQATGQYHLVGRFTSIQITIRNATEPYLEMNQRIPRYLDGEIQIGWVLERGMVDTRVIQQTFGYSALTRELRLSRNPRFQITFEINAPELDKAGSAAHSGRSSIGNGELLIQQNSAGNFASRKGSGQLMLTFCKVDSLTFGATAGRNVIANRWEGLAEGIEEVDRTSVWSGLTLPTQNTGETALQLSGTINESLRGSDGGRPSGVGGVIS